MWVKILTYRDTTRKVSTENFKLIHDSITTTTSILVDAHIFCFEIKKFNNFQRKFSKSRMKQIKFWATAELRKILLCAFGTTWGLNCLSQYVMISRSKMQAHVICLNLLKLVLNTILEFDSNFSFRYYSVLPLFH